MVNIISFAQFRSSKFCIQLIAVGIEISDFFFLQHHYKNPIPKFNSGKAKLASFVAKNNLAQTIPTPPPVVFP